MDTPTKKYKTRLVIVGTIEAETEEDALNLLFEQAKSHEIVDWDIKEIVE